MSYKNQILKSASELFAEKGFKESSIAELSRLSGAAEGTIFYHFKSKEDILINLLQKVKEDILERVAKHHWQGETGLERALEVINFYFELSEDMKDEFLLLFRNYPYHLASVNTRCRHYIEAIYNCFVDLLAKAVEKGQSDGSVRDIHPVKAGLIVFSMASGMARFNFYNLFPVGPVYRELMQACARILASDNAEIPQNLDGRQK
ncbi:MAG: TetR/AcrR family transcriptional regulator [Desulfonatronovibrionaceae bacterium]